MLQLTKCLMDLGSFPFSPANTTKLLSSILIFAELYQQTKFLGGEIAFFYTPFNLRTEWQAVFWYFLHLVLGSYILACSIAPQVFGCCRQAGRQAGRQTGSEKNW